MTDNWKAQVGVIIMWTVLITVEQPCGMGISLAENQVCLKLQYKNDAAESLSAVNKFTNLCAWHVLNACAPELQSVEQSISWNVQ